MTRLTHLASRALALGVSLAAVGSVAAAQEQGNIEIGAAARWTTFDNSLRLDEKWGYAGTLAYFFRKDLALELQTGQIDTDVQRGPQNGRDVTHRTSYARLLKRYEFRPGTSFHLGGGYAFASYHDITADGDHGLTALVGVRQGITNRLGLRIDGTADRYGSPSNKSQFVKRNWNYSVQTGLSFLYGRIGPKTPPPPPDADGDGVIDANDRCPGTPMGDRVDASGCSLPKDADGDGVVDANDKCPNTPAGDKVDATGCSLPKDSDNDGVTDDRDKCPNTPAGSTVDADGCVPPPAPPADSDNDGVPDTADKCPNTAAGTTVDASGCAVLFTAEKRTLTLQGVNFETGKAVLTPESQSILDPVAASLVANPEVKIEVGGYTDNVGARASNVRLSQARAAAVRDYLASKGVDAARMTAKGYGPDAPVASNATAAGRAQNRRVELKRVD